MAPRPKTYGARRSHANPAGELVNLTTADKPELKLRNVDGVSTRLRIGKGRDFGKVQKEETKDRPLQGQGKEDESASGIRIGEHAAPSQTANVEDESTIASSAPEFLKGKKMSAENTLSPETSITENGLSRKSIRKSVDRPATSINQSLIIDTASESITISHICPVAAEPILSPNGFTEDHQQPPVSRDVDLKDVPSDVQNLPIWVAQLVSKYSDRNPLSAISLPKRKDSSPQLDQDVEMTDALDNVEDVRMTRGKEKRRLQQLKGKEPAKGESLPPSCFDIAPQALLGSGTQSWVRTSANTFPTIDMKGNVVAIVGSSVRARDAAPVERRLKDGLNDELKQKLFGSSKTTDVPAAIVERNACGKLLFNTLVDLGDLTNRNSAAVLKSALDERKDDAPFLSALKILASSSEVIAFVDFLFSKDDGAQREASSVDESRPSSTGVETSGATTITETSGPTSRPGTSISESESSSKARCTDKATENQNLDKQQRSQEVIQALEAAIAILDQIQQGEDGMNHMPPYTGRSMMSDPTGQRHMATYGNTYGPPHPNHPTRGMAHGPPVGVNLTNYASPYANHMATYASPYSNPVNQPPANYASPYSNAAVPSQASGSSLVVIGDNQADKNGGHKIHHDNEGNHTLHQNIVGAGTEPKQGNDEAAGQDNSVEEDAARKAKRNADDQGVSHEKDGTSKVSDEATDQGNISEDSNVVDPDDTDVDDANKQEKIGDNERNGDDDLTDDDLTAAKTDDKIVAPPDENHKLFTGERLGDFTSTENIDWLLTMGNGGKIPTPTKKRRMSFPPRTRSSQADSKVETEVNRIINEILLCRNGHGYPGGTMKHLFHASAEAQRLAGELRRLIAIAEPMVNTIMPLAEGKARLRFYRELEGRAVREKQDREIQANISRYYGPPIQVQQWIPPPVAPVGFPMNGFPIPPPLPSNAPMQAPFVRRGNVIAAPPGGRNMEEEKKAETYGYPPTPGSRPGGSQRGQKRKRAARH